jgi:hypothetical protein
MPCCSEIGTRPLLVSVVGSCSSLRQASNMTNLAERAVEQFENIIELHTLVPEARRLRLPSIAGIR